MYYCQDCKKEFKKLKKLIETHGHTFPPYEEFYLCPHCNSSRVKKLPTRHCACCGAKMSGQGEYCSTQCKTKGEYLWAKERRIKEYWQTHPLYEAVREVEKYNKENGKNLSYGQYFAGVR